MLPFHMVTKHAELMDFAEICRLAKNMSPEPFFEGPHEQMSFEPKNRITMLFYPCIPLFGYTLEALPDTIA